MSYRTTKKLRKAVGEILEKYERARNDDSTLIKIVCSEYGFDPIAKASSIERCKIGRAHV